MCVYVCVWEREREGGHREREIDRPFCQQQFVCSSLSQVMLLWGWVNGLIAALLYKMSVLILYTSWHKKVRYYELLDYLFSFTAVWWRLSAACRDTQNVHTKLCWHKIYRLKTFQPDPCLHSTAIFKVATTTTTTIIKSQQRRGKAQSQGRTENNHLGLFTSVIVTVQKIQNSCNTRNIVCLRYITVNTLHKVTN